jgi:hypothetical protein
MPKTLCLLMVLLLLVTPAWNQERGISKASSAPGASKRLALVIGNSYYQYTSPLRNPANDARAMSYLFRKPRPEASALRVALQEYLAYLPNGEFLTSSKFVKRGLQRAINKFRNGGAHDSPISEATCRECIDTLIGTSSSPGYVSLLAEWKRGASGSTEADA